MNSTMNPTMNTVKIYDHPDQLPSDLLQSCRKMPLPTTMLMCPPENFDVVDVKNPHMEGNIGNVDKAKAKAQWEAVRDAFAAAESQVDLIEPVAGCEDMVFCANQTFVGLDADGKKLCILSQMKHESRQREVAAFGKWFGENGYRVENLPVQIGFEGSGDAIWHPGRALVWGGSGFRSQSEAYVHVSKFFGVPVIRLPLKSDRFYHLDTCFCAIDESTVLINPRSLTEEGVQMIHALFKNVIKCDETEANEGMACNATAIGAKHVVIQEGNQKTTAFLQQLGYTVHEVDTSEYLKSGGSVFCMKMYVF
jgi:N-dimethylarginine dimethylaminohydrolase